MAAPGMRALVLTDMSKLRVMVEVGESNLKNIKIGNEMVSETDNSLEAIVSAAGKVASFLEEIASASKEQSQAIDQITAALDQIDQVTQGNTANAEETASHGECR